MMNAQITARHALGFTLLILATAWSAGANEQRGGSVQSSDIDLHNYVLGTQTIGVPYGFTEETRLVETAQAILDLGSNVLKITMGKDSYSLYGLPKPESVTTLTKLARDEPSYRRVLDMPFAYYHIWTYSFTGGWWADPLSQEDRDREYREIYDFARYLLKTYSGTGKTLFLGHWEGDWHLRPDFDVSRDPSSDLIQRMVDWLNTRQRAVDDAKRDTPHENVQLYHYTEVNLVRLAVAGGVCLTNNVLPHTNVDYVSYSAYDLLWRVGTDEGLKDRMFEALDYLESKLPPKEGILGKRVYIGEYGFPLRGRDALRVCSPEEQAESSHKFTRAALAWGCPFVLYWQMYCNEVRDGVHNGFWMTDDKGERQPVYHFHQRYYQQAREFVTQFTASHGRTPTPDEFRQAALKLLDQQTPEDRSGTAPSDSTAPCAREG